MPKCFYCNSELGPRASGCLPLIIGLFVGIGLLWIALKVMDGLTYGGIWK